MNRANGYRVRIGAARVILVSAAAGVAGCATGISSERIAAGTEAPDGLVYFMPNRDIVVTLVRKAGTDDKFDVATPEATPDPSAAFVARIPRNDAGKVESTITVNAKGLLNNDSTTTLTSGVSELLTNLAKSAGVLHTLVDLPPSAAPCPDGTYQVTIAPKPNVTFASGQAAQDVNDSATKLCDYVILISRQAESTADDLKSNKKAETKNKKHAGLFYRMPMPYRVDITRSGFAKSFVTYSPTGSPTYFLPLAHSTFATNTATLGFDNGVPTKYSQKIENEGVALLALPATVLEAYFSAISSILGKKKTASIDEVAYADQLQKAAIAEVQRAQCDKALTATPDDLVAIKKACGSN